MPYTPESLNDPTSLERWQRRLEFLEREFPDHLEGIVCAKLAILEYEKPNSAQYYKKLSQEVTHAINEAWNEDPDNFGFDDAQEVTRKFLIKHGLSDWLEDEVTATAEQISFFDNGLGGILIGGNFYPEDEARSLWEDWEDE